MGRRVGIFEALAPCGIDLLLYDPDEFEEMRRQSSLVRQALVEGKVLHDARP